MSATESLTEFFNAISNDYDAMVARSLFRYQEMFWAMLYYLPEDFSPSTILELGCGTGNLTRLLATRWPAAKITAVDLSQDMLVKTQEKLPETLLTLIHAGFETLALPDVSYDLVISSIAVHHISDPAKAKLIQDIGVWLSPGGYFVLGDQVQSNTLQLHQADVTFFEATAKEKGALESDIAEWRDHRNALDHYAKVRDLTQWMEEAGLINVELLWRYCFWAVLQAQKPIDA